LKVKVAGLNHIGLHYSVESQWSCLRSLFEDIVSVCVVMWWQELSRAINNVMAMDADLSVDKIEINPSNVAATISATSQERIQIAPAKKPKPQPKPKPQKAGD